MAFLIIALSLIAIFIIGYLVYAVVISFYMVKQFVEPNFDSRENRKIENHKMHYDKFEKDYVRINKTYSMSDGYLIHGDFIPNQSIDKIMVICHGHKSNREAAIKYSRIYYDLGYSLFIYDHRSHGDNQRTYVTMGYKESQDLNQIIDLLKNEYPNCPIALSGVSMGAATTLLLTQYRQDITFIVSDCAYASLKNMCYDIIKKHHTPPWTLYPFLHMVMKNKYGFSFKQTSPKDVLKNNNVPILFIHGEKDETVKLYNVYELYNATKGYKELCIIKDAGHGRSIRKDRQKYIEVVNNFINNINRGTTS